MSKKENVLAFWKNIFLSNLLKFTVKHITGICELPLVIFFSGSSGLCAESDLTAPLFGQDVTTGCQLKLALSTFSDCAVLRRLVEDQQRMLVGSANYVSRYGNPTLTDVANDWLPINAR